MKHKKLFALSILYAAALLSALTASISFGIIPENDDIPAIAPTSVSTPTPTIVPHGDSEESSDILFFNDETQGYEYMALEQYICGVLAGEMSANYEKQALMAQAVAARTYVAYRLWKYENGDTNDLHPDSAVCTDSSHCMAYLSLSSAQEKWGKDWTDKYWQNIVDAVADTEGEILVYDGEPINALFCAASCGKTEASIEVWGGSDVPYLQSVDSEPDLNSPWSNVSVRFSENEFKNIFLSQYPDARFPDDSSDWCTNIVRSDAGYVTGVRIGGVTLTGRTVRKIYGLKSANFDITVGGGEIVFTTRGYGHGVGMSQYGANELAKNGMGYRDILLKYYTDVEIKKMLFKP
ncbi:MAG: stage II sporulation protein D [Ruminococcaceae bacterium]|nr:stage II sporulation protein D [Oscillospiraceae bacterium]